MPPEVSACVTYITQAARTNVIIGIFVAYGMSVLTTNNERLNTRTHLVVIANAAIITLDICNFCSEEPSKLTNIINESSKVY